MSSDSKDSTMPKPNQDSSDKGSVGTTDSSGPAETKEENMTFPRRLMDILADERSEGIINWLPHGWSFRIMDSEKMESEILPQFRFFKMSKLRSFTRKLSRWGFREISEGPDSGAYFHINFQRNNYELCDQMVCQSTPFASNIPQPGDQSPVVRKDAPSRRSSLIQEAIKAGAQPHKMGEKRCPPLTSLTPSTSAGTRSNSSHEGASTQNPAYLGDSILQRVLQGKTDISSNHDGSLLAKLDLRNSLKAEQERLLSIAQMEADSHARKEEVLVQAIIAGRKQEAARREKLELELKTIRQLIEPEETREVGATLTSNLLSQTISGNPKQYQNSSLLDAYEILKSRGPSDESARPQPSSILDTYSSLLRDHSERETALRPTTDLAGMYELLKARRNETDIIQSSYLNDAYKILDGRALGGVVQRRTSGVAGQNISNDNQLGTSIPGLPDAYSLLLEAGQRN